MMELHAAGRSEAAVATLLELAADRVTTPELASYEAAIRGNVASLAGLST